MSQNILVTYEHISGYNTFAWFYDEEEARIFIETESTVKEVIECYDCIYAKTVDIK